MLLKIHESVWGFFPQTVFLISVRCTEMVKSPSSTCCMSAQQYCTLVFLLVPLFFALGISQIHTLNISTSISSLTGARVFVSFAVLNLFHRICSHTTVLQGKKSTGSYTHWHQDLCQSRGAALGFRTLLIQGVLWPFMTGKEETMGHYTLSHNV